MREPQLALDRRQRHPDHFRGFLQRQSAEVPLLDDLSLPRIDRLQTREGIVQIGERVGMRAGGDEVVIPLDGVGAAAPSREARRTRAARCD
jgi:hypothetical protein